MIDLLIYMHVAGIVLHHSVQFVVWEAYLKVKYFRKKEENNAFANCQLEGEAHLFIRQYVYFSMDSLAFRE